MRNNHQAVKNTSYPTIPAIWPNRAVRRALRFARALPTEWGIFFGSRPDLLTLAKAVR